MTQVPASPPLSARPLDLSPQRVGGRSAPPPPRPPGTPLRPFPSASATPCRTAKTGPPPCFPRHSPSGKIRLGLRTAVENP